MLRSIRSLLFWGCVALTVRFESSAEVEGVGVVSELKLSFSKLLQARELRGGEHSAIASGLGEAAENLNVWFRLKDHGPWERRRVDEGDKLSIYLPRDQVVELKVWGGFSYIWSDHWLLTQKPMLFEEVPLVPWTSPSLRSWSDASWIFLNRPNSKIENDGGLRPSFQRWPSHLSTGPEMFLMGHSNWKKGPWRSPDEFLEGVLWARSQSLPLVYGGMQRCISFGSLFWSPLSLLLLGNYSCLGVHLEDIGDEALYRSLLVEGYRVSPVKHLIPNDQSSRLGVSICSGMSFREALSRGAVLTGEQVQLDFGLVGEVDEFFLGDDLSGELPPASYVPKLEFALNSQLGGVRSFELYNGEQLIQESRVTVPLKNGVAQWHMEEFAKGDALTLVMERSSGERMISGPIVVGEALDEEIRRFPVEIYWPLELPAGHLIIREGEQRFIFPLKSGELWTGYLPLHAKLQLESEGSHLHDRQIWELLFEASSDMMVRPMEVLELLELWRSRFPIRWSP